PIYCLASNRAAEHANGVGLPRLAFKQLFHPKGDIAHDMALGTFAPPFRFTVRDIALEDDFGLIDQFVESGRNYRGGSYARKDRCDRSNEKEMVQFFHGRFWQG